MKNIILKTGMIVVISIFSIGNIVHSQHIEESVLIKNLKSSNWQERASSAIKLGSKETLKNSLTPLLEVLKEECANPTPSPSNTSKGYTSDHLKGAYQNALIEIGKQNKKEVISRLQQEYIKGTPKSAFQRRITIILGYLKCEEVFDQLVDIVLNSKDEYDRTEACLALGHLGRKEAIPILKRVLNDPFRVEISHPPECALIAYPIQGAAKAALELLGEENFSK